MGNNILKFILDIGNSKIKMLAGELSEDGSKLKILKHVEVDSEGIKKSIIESPALLSESIRKAKELIEEDLKLNIEKVNLGIGGTKVCSRTTNIKLSFEDLQVESLRKMKKHMFEKLNWGGGILGSQSEGNHTTTNRTLMISVFTFCDDLIELQNVMLLQER